MMLIKRSLIFVIFSLVLLSCVSRKDIVLFEDIEKLREKIETKSDNILIKPDDRITIRVNALEQDAANPFNLTSFLGSSESPANSNLELIPYQVDKNGMIKMPVLGAIKASGYGIFELEDRIEKKLEDFLPSANVTVRLVNFEVSVLGEVRSPGTFRIEDDHIAVTKALGLAGDVTIYGERSNILIVRNENGKIEHGYLDLTDVSSMESPFYNLTQNDIVYVEPRNARRQSAGFFNNAPTYISLASVVTSIIILLTR